MLIIDTRCDPPCSVKAFLEGHTNLKNDMPFVIAALNADCVFWMLTKDGLKQRIYTDTAQISQNISTETVGRGRETSQPATDTQRMREAQHTLG